MSVCNCLSWWKLVSYQKLCCLAFKITNIIFHSAGSSLISCSGLLIRILFPRFNTFLARPNKCSSTSLFMFWNFKNISQQPQLIWNGITAESLQTFGKYFSRTTASKQFQSLTGAKKKKRHVSRSNNGIYSTLKHFRYPAE